jgi:hypothetical protein
MRCRLQVEIRFARTCKHAAVVPVELVYAIYYPARSTFGCANADDCAADCKQAGA